MKIQLAQKSLSALFLVLLTFCMSCTKNNDTDLIKNSDPDIETQGDIQDYRSQSINYGLSMFQDVIATGEENTLISPYSLQSALYMTMNGSEGQTLEEFRTALSVGNFYPNGLGSFYQELADDLEPTGDNTIFNSQNKVFYYPALFTPSESYISDIESNYSGTFSEEDFSNPETVDVINGWVNDATEGRIEKVINQIQSDEAIFLINALIFTADWSLGFEEYATRDRVFTTGGGSQIEVPTMSSDETRPFVETDDYAAVDIAVKDGDYAVTFILPSESSNINDFVSAFDPDQYADIYDKIQNDRVQIYLPKFELATSMNMKDILIDRGMKTAFNSAELSRMGDFAGTPYLSRVLHDVFIKVDEKGIEGAAVTTVGVGIESVPPTLEFNRPFVFVVRHIETQVPLFIGKVGNPLG